jgi:diguanylate cyclase (GGDEF)-like protein
VIVLSAIGAVLSERADRLAWLSSEQLKESSALDPLTQLFNRGYLMEQGRLRLAHMQREGRPISLCLLDVDFFKAYNDTLGHLAGDECLRRVAAVIDSYSRRPLDIAARFGGEEFVLLLYGCEVQAAAALAERLRLSVAALNVPFPRSPMKKLTISIGVAGADNPHLTTLEELLGFADRRLYAAKKGGRNRVVVSEAPVAPAA